jgi:hypothetical protein
MSSEILVGPPDAALEAKMQLELPGGARIIKCFGGSSVADIQSALSAIGVMTAAQQLAKVGSPESILTPDTAVASLNRCKLRIITSAAGSVAPATPVTATPAAAVALSNRGSSPPPALNPHVGIDSAELEQRKRQMVADMKKKEDDARRILLAHEQEQKDRALEKKMIQDKIIADEQKKRNALAEAGAPDRIIIGDSSSGGEVVAKIRVQTKCGGVEVTCFDNEAILGTLRAILVGKGLCSQDSPIIQAMQQ